MIILSGLVPQVQASQLEDDFRQEKDDVLFYPLNWGCVENYGNQSEVLSEKMCAGNLQSI